MVIRHPQLICECLDRKLSLVLCLLIRLIALTVLGLKLLFKSLTLKLLELCRLKWENQFQKRGWTADQITETIADGDAYSALNKVNKGNSATRYVHPTTGRTVIIDDVTREILQVGGDGFQF